MENEGIDCKRFDPSEDKGNASLDCDQVSWLLNAIDKYLPNNYASIKQRQMMVLSLLYEFMNIAKLSFEDVRAAFNASPREVAWYLDKNEDE